MRPPRLKPSVEGTEVHLTEFTHIVTAEEVRSGYLNLKDEQGVPRGDSFPAKHLTRLAIHDGKGRLTFAKKHHHNQIWGTLYKWFEHNSVQAGTRILVRHDPGEQTEGCPVIHLVTVEGPIPPTLAAIQPGASVTADVASEIPVGLEKQLEDFLAVNLHLIESGLKLYVDEDGREGKQYPTDVGIIDLLCIRPSGGYLVIELKRGRTSDVAVGQISRYMGWVKENLATGHLIEGLILAHDRDDNLKYAVAANPAITVRYFKLKLELVSESDL